MKPSTKVLALVPATQTIGQKLVLLSVLTLLVLFGTSIAHSHSASTQQAGAWVAASVGDIHMGSGG